MRTMTALTAMILFRKLCLPCAQSRRSIVRRAQFAPDAPSLRPHVAPRDSGRSHAPRSPRKRQGRRYHRKSERGNMLDRAWPCSPCRPNPPPSRPPPPRRRSSRLRRLRRRRLPASSPPSRLRFQRTRRGFSSSTTRASTPTPRAPTTRSGPSASSRHASAVARARVAWDRVPAREATDDELAARAHARLRRAARASCAGSAATSTRTRTSPPRASRPRGWPPGARRARRSHDGWRHRPTTSRGVALLRPPGTTPGRPRRWGSAC